MRETRMIKAYPVSDMQRHCQAARRAADPSD
jgi:hypothetical protein